MSVKCIKCEKHSSTITYKDKNYCTWYCAKKGQGMMDSVVHEFANVGLTLLVIAVGGVIIYLLDRYVFNRDRYNNKGRK